MTNTKTDVDIKRDRSTAMTGTGGDWDPFTSMRQQFDRMMRDFDWPDFRFGPGRRPFDLMRDLPDVSMNVPLVDLVERGDGYELQVELPGMTRDQIEIKVSDGMMSIKGEKSAERVEDKDNYHLQERSFGAFHRSFRLPAGVNPDKIDATFENGVLKIVLPKSPESMQKERKIEVKAT